MRRPRVSEAGLKLGLRIHVLNASTEQNFDEVFTRLHELKVGALVIAQDVLFNARSEQLAALTIRHAIPAVYPQPEFAAAGGLISYGASGRDAWRQVGIYVGRILKGESPAELPVQRATKVDLIINLAQSRHRFLRCKCLLLTQSGHRVAITRAPPNVLV